MWKIRLFFLLVVMGQAIASPPNNITLAGGLMRFQGEILSDTCIVDDGEQYLTVPMGQVSNNKFIHAGDDSDPVLFSLYFKHCSQNVKRNMNIVFRGVADQQNPDLLAIEQGNNVAHGIGIALFDEQGDLIPVNSGILSVRDINSGPLVLNLIAKYRSTSSDVTGGLANAQAWFSLTYQ